MPREEAQQERSAAQLALLAGFLPRFEQPDAIPGQWMDLQPRADGTRHMPWFQFSPLMAEFERALYDAGWIEAFDWPAWIATDEALSLHDDPDALAKATATQLGRLLTAIFRQERFSEGNVAAAFEAGLISGILRRAASLSSSAGA